MAVFEASAGCPAPSALVGRIIRLRRWAVWLLNELGDSAAQSILIGEPLLADQVRVLRTDHPDTLATRNNLGRAYQAAGRTARRSLCTSRTCQRSVSVTQSHRRRCGCCTSLLYFAPRVAMARA